MKKRIGTVLMVFFITLPSAYAQIDSRADVRFGVARTILGTGDIITTTFETELNYKINSYFTTAFSINYGIGDEQTFGTASYIQGNTNVFMSPFRNTKLLDFRIGGGLSYYIVTDVIAQNVGCGSFGCIAGEYDYARRREFGYNVITEIAYQIDEKFLLGLKLYTQPYFNGDINSGLMVKFGVKI
ncbi:hypothetical protein [Catalinimonas niigatensis]|uniref:hypothetical protein n=1 Tax=Catalinimonas niigatensis TaxID=1397264 RepID=UPI002666F1C6|nr:hypothetical protein [Catalinimonas niigatensis]WPP47976.1 hypothetical protein PZB72_14960 [Catalinimonas niigatensis]